MKHETRYSRSHGMEMEKTKDLFSSLVIDIVI